MFGFTIFSRFAWLTLAVVIFTFLFSPTQRVRAADPAEPPAYQAIRADVDDLKSRVAALEAKVNPPGYAGAKPVIPPCYCGCMDGKGCLCKNCADRTADKTQFTAGYAGVTRTEYRQVQVCDGNSCRWVTVPVTVTEPAKTSEPNPYLTAAPANSLLNSTTVTSSTCATCSSGVSSGAPSSGDTSSTAGAAPKHPVIHAIFHPFERFRARRGGVGGGCSSCGG